MTGAAIWFPTVRAQSGSDVFTERLCAALNARGIRAEITWLPLRAEYSPWTVPIPKPPKWANLVHINTWLHPRFVPWHLPIVATIHHCVHDPALEPFKTPLQRIYHRQWIHRIEMAILKHSTVVTAVSRYSAHRTREVFGRSDLNVIYNGTDTEIFRPIERSMPNEPFRLLYVGNWIERKGIDLLGPILSILGPGFELYYIADRHHRHRRYDLPENCHCLGKPDTTGLVRAYQEADALLFPSRLEGFGLVAAEAMACGVPVIAANNSALPEVVKHKVTGWLCHNHTPVEFAKACQLLADNVSTWQEMRVASRAHVLSMFNKATMVDQYHDIYRQLLSVHY